MQTILQHQVRLAFAVTFLAGLATVMSGVLVLFFRQSSYRLLSFALVFAARVTV